MHILLDRHSSSFFIHFNLIITLLLQISLTFSLQDLLPFVSYASKRLRKGTVRVESPGITLTRMPRVRNNPRAVVLSLALPKSYQLYSVTLG